MVLQLSKKCTALNQAINASSTAKYTKLQKATTAKLSFCRLFAQPQANLQNPSK